MSSNPLSCDLSTITRASHQAESPGLLRARDLGLICMVRIQERNRENRMIRQLSRAHGLYDDGCHDHQQLVLASLKRLALEELAKNRHVADPRNPFHLLDHTVVNESGDGKTLTVRQVHLRLHPSRGKGRHGKALQLKCICEVQ